jgi:1,4-dihydroxy-2-naphthoate octaprenyltransferase
VFLDKWTNLHFHQVIDYASDLKGGVTTYAVRIGPDRARKTLKAAAWLSSLWSTAVILSLLRLLPQWRALLLFAVGGTVLGCGAYAFFVRHSSQRVTPLVHELSWLYLGLTFAVFRILPLALMIRLSLRDPNMGAAAALMFLFLLIESWFFLRYRYE